MSAEEHHEAAEAHGAAAEAEDAKYDPDAEEARKMTGKVAVPYNPTAEHRRHAAKHRQHAADHDAAAKELEAFEEEGCHGFTPEVRASCPLMGKIVSFEDIEEKPAGSGGPAQPAMKRGVRIRFAPGVDVDAVVEHMRCHLAFARKVGRKGMDHCPLYVESVAIETEAGAPAKSKHGVKGHSSTAGKTAPGTKTEGAWRAVKRVHVEKGAEAGTVDLIVDDESLLDEVRARVRAHVPQGD